MRFASKCGQWKGQGATRPRGLWVIASPPLSSRRTRPPIVRSFSHPDSKRYIVEIETGYPVAVPIVVGVEIDADCLPGVGA